VTTETKNPTILVVGATGTTGGGVVDNLVASDRWHVRAMTRDSHSETARSLSSRGVEVFQADMNDTPSLLAAMQGAYGVFSVQGQAPEGDPMQEARQGIAVIDTAIAAKVEHVVYSSSCGAKEPGRGVNYWDAKRKVADHLHKAPIVHTLIRPVSFMENYVGDVAAIERGIITGMLTPDKTLQVISGHDIGAWAAAAFDRRDEFAGQEVDIASETITMNGIAGALGRVVGRDVEYRPLPREQSAIAAPSAIAMTKWYEEYGYDEDIPALTTRWGVPMLAFEEWLRLVWLPRKSTISV
jgi:uncharacterized protein YbjT (DUF2867 family)